MALVTPGVPAGRLVPWNSDFGAGEFRVVLEAAMGTTPASKAPPPPECSIATTCDVSLCTCREDDRPGLLRPADPAFPNSFPVPVPGPGVPPAPNFGGGAHRRRALAFVVPGCGPIPESAN